jgi:hypothetical protein
MELVVANTRENNLCLNLSEQAAFDSTVASFCGAGHEEWLKQEVPVSDEEEQWWAKIRTGAKVRTQQTTCYLVNHTRVLIKPKLWAWE